jgi:N6-L-threonylcarbamoyladenine synthase
LGRNSVACSTSQDNIGEGLQLQKKEVDEMLVYIINKHGRPLMPCSSGKAKKLLKAGKAKVVKREPFTLQLLYGSSGYTQPVVLGVDAGSKFIGLSATTEDKELFSSEVQLRTDVTDLISTRRELRRNRRNRKTRYRQKRFNNRTKAKKPGWIAPTIRNRIAAHLKVIENVHKILPITLVVVETASFDIQKIQNPDISGTEYQEGEQLGFWNIREYVLFRDNHTCQHCKGRSKDPILNVHHIQSRKTGGNRPDNLLTLCETCHDQYHKGKITLEIPKSNGFKHQAFMGIMRNYLLRELKTKYQDVRNTFGYITKNTRIQNNLLKSHRTDAFCIAGNIRAERLPYYFLQKQMRKHNRQIHKTNPSKNGIRKLNQAPYIVEGFRLFDKVLYNNIKCFIFGRRKSGYFDLRTLSGEIVHRSAKCKELILLTARRTLLMEVKWSDAIPPIP